MNEFLFKLEGSFWRVCEALHLVTPINPNEDMAYPYTRKAADNARYIAAAAQLKMKAPKTVHVYIKSTFTDGVIKTVDSYTYNMGDDVTLNVDSTGRGKLLGSRLLGKMFGPKLQSINIQFNRRAPGRND